ncbi:MAG: glycogen debranching protein GlgX [Geminicoccaceae bacterium]|nr:glycogen debranching protein GlgX [Geminicoccaceae bacterium]
MTSADRPASSSRPDGLWPGCHHPLGATVCADGINFAVFSEHATRIEIAIHDPQSGEETARLELPEYTDQIHHGFLAGGRPGLHYRLHAHGPFDPARGHRFDPDRPLLDPYATRWSHGLRWRGQGDGLVPDVPFCIVEDMPSPIPPETKPHRPASQMVIYEAHVRGLTALHPDLPQDIRGTCAALGSEPVIDHLRNLGINTIELMPCQAFFDEQRLARTGLTNYWGYNPIGFFVVEPRYAATGDARGELREAIARLHAADIEVILDVVYNHSGEGDGAGPTVAFRGLDNHAYYKLDPEAADGYLNVTGCGNTLDLAHPRVLQLAMDSLRYWVEIIGVDGFRFDLATTLGREFNGFDPGSGFFDAIAQDPVLSRVKLIAEPWDIGPDGYRMGGFGPGWAEWNDRYRDTARAFWRGDAGTLSELASRLLGSADLFEHQGRRPWASINFITSHDGFTLHDLVSYEERHNEDNLEGNRDGHGHNLSWNNGVEGRSDDAGVIAARLRDRKNLLATLLLSQGTPMLLMGDETGRTQGGNNNAYCQDNPISWLDWETVDRELLDFTRKLIELRARHPVFRRVRFMHGENGNVVWWHSEGRPMGPEDWHGHCVGLLLDGRITEERDERGRKLDDERWLLVFNAGETVRFHLPEGHWQPTLSGTSAKRAETGRTIILDGRSFTLLVDSNESR